MGVNVGILGFAHGHVSQYCAQWTERLELGASVSCGWDHDRERLAVAVQCFGLEAAESAEALLSRPDIAAVVIGAETSMHAELVEHAAAAGQAIILQKPMALTLPEADRIVAAVQASGVPFTMAWQMRADPQNQTMRKMVLEGALGRVFMVRRRHGLPMCLDDNFASSWHVDPKLNRDMWADDASHPIDFVYWLFGRPESVTAEIVSLNHPAMPMDNGIAIFRYPDGPLVEVTCSFTNRAGENTTEIICEHGTIIQNYGDGPSCSVPRPAGAAGLKWYDARTGQWTCCEVPTPDHHGVRIQGLAAPLAAFLNGAGAAIATAEEGREALRMLLACYVSEREGRRTPLDDPAIATV